LAAGGKAKQTVFSGVGKTVAEINYALEQGVRCFNVESIAELERINNIAGERGVRAPISIRINPDVDAQTHPYISTGLKENKFGIDINSALHVYECAAQMSHIHITGVDDREDARQYCQLNIVVEKSQFPELEQGEYYWHQLEGLTVITCQGDTRLGVVDSLMETGANDVLVVKGDRESLDREERLIPYTEQFVLRVDLDAGKIDVDWDPEF